MLLAMPSGFQTSVRAGPGGSQTYTCTACVRAVGMQHA
jgi:hypothetical protein